MHITLGLNTNWTSCFIPSVFSTHHACILLRVYLYRFGSHISGGDTVSRSLRLNNTSAYGGNEYDSLILVRYFYHPCRAHWLFAISPLDIRLDWLTYNKDPEDRKLLDLLVAYGEPFPLKDVDGNEVVGGPNSHMSFLPRLDQNQTPSTEGSSSSLRTRSETSVSECLNVFIRMPHSFFPSHLGNEQTYICRPIGECVDLVLLFDVPFLGVWRRTVRWRGAGSASDFGFSEKTVFCINPAPWGICFGLPILHHSTADSTCLYSFSNILAFF